MPVTITESELSTAINDLTGSSARLLPVARAIVSKYAGASTPTEILNEAVIRVAGFLLESPASNLRSMTLGDLRRTWTPTHVSALRHSGAQALLSQWKVRRGSLA